MAWVRETGGGDPPPPTPQVEPDLLGLLPKTYINAPVTSIGVLGGASIQTNLQNHFAHHHVWDTIFILDEGIRPYPRCPQ